MPVSVCVCVGVSASQLDWAFSAVVDTWQTLLGEQNGVDCDCDGNCDVDVDVNFGGLCATIFARVFITLLLLIKLNEVTARNHTQSCQSKCERESWAAGAVPVAVGEAVAAAGGGRVKASWAAAVQIPRQLHNEISPSSH